MITYSEENAVKLSPTKKDFYQMWMEVLDNARAISNRWDPSSTNESDPGIILLKELYIKKFMVTQKSTSMKNQYQYSIIN